MKIGIVLTNQHPPGSDVVTALEGMPVGLALGSMRLISDELLPALRRVGPDLDFTPRAS
jgi:hypothetical protein